jgi:two-component system cell cycle sensor histidine kinase/response regulator CckA
MVMPNMNGSDCFKALQEIDHNVRVILSSGFSREENVGEMKNNGLAGFIRKPYRSADLSQIVFDTLKQ